MKFPGSYLTLPRSVDSLLSMSLKNDSASAVSLPHAIASTVQQVEYTNAFVTCIFRIVVRSRGPTSCGAQGQQ